MDATSDADLIVDHAGDVNAFAASIVHGTPRMTGALAPGLLPGGFAAWIARLMIPSMTDAVFARALEAAGVPRRYMVTATRMRLSRRLSAGVRPEASAEERTDVRDEAECGRKPRSKPPGKPSVASTHAVTKYPWRKRVVLETAESPLLNNMVAISRRVVPPRRAWRDRFEPTGYWFLDERQHEPDARLRAFVERGEPPIVIGFGSMSELDARVQGIAAGIVEAVRASGRRAVVQAAEGLGDADVPETMHVAGYVPHDWLFPRSAGVVHHGGAGTSAAALRARVPQAIVSVFGDQPAWGKLLHQRGVAAAPTPMSMASFTASALRARIRAMDDAVRERAKALGDLVAGEDGVGRACALI